MRYEAIIIWVTGEKETHQYKTKEEANKCCRNYVRAFGDQVEWTGIREVR